MSLNLRIEPYGKVMIVRGDDTKKYKDYLKAVGCAFTNGNLDNKGPGWFFQKFKQAAVENAIKNQFKGVTPAAPYQKDSTPTDPSNPPYAKYMLTETKVAPPPPVVTSSVQQPLQQLPQQPHQQPDPVLVERVKVLEDLVKLLLSENKSMMENPKVKTFLNIATTNTSAATTTAEDEYEEDEDGDEIPAASLRQNK